MISKSDLAECGPPIPNEKVKRKREGPAMLKNLSFNAGARVRSAVPKLTMAALIVLVLAISASAYTLVFRNGQRIEIPDEFMLTRTTLTYEISPGFNKTLLLTL